MFPESILAGLKEGVVAQSIDKKIISVECMSPRKFTSDVHHSVDDRPFGGGDGMLMMADPLDQALSYFRRLSDEPAEFLYLSARGEVFNDAMAKNLAQKKTINLICGRYGGVDQRFLVKNKIREISIGDYILSGGELGALVIIDAVARHIPGVLGNCKSSQNDSFGDGLLEAASFTRTRDWQGLETPKVLMSGDHKKIDEWRSYVSVFSTIHNREDLFLKKHYPLKFLQSAKLFFEKMPEPEKLVCGLLDSDKIMLILSSEISQREKN